MNVLRRLCRYLPRPPSTNYNLRQLSQSPYAMLSHEAVVLDVGCKSIQGAYAFPGRHRSSRVIGLDIKAFEGVTVVGDAHELPFSSNSLHCVLCVSVLQYVHRPERVVDEIFRVLRPGGIIYINVPFIFRDAPDPDDLFRFSVSGIRVLCKSFEKIQSGYNRGPASSLCDLLVHFGAILCCFNNRRLYSFLVDLFQWALFWIKYLDRWIGHYEVARTIHSGAFFLGSKPAPAQPSLEKPDSVGPRALEAVSF
jgi:SAM-dependent methyltransferase